MKRAALLLASLMACTAACERPAVAQDGIANPPTIAAFDAAAGMRVLYPEYDAAAAVAWLAGDSAAKRPQEADAQVSALLAAAYDDRGTERGLLVVQRQRLHEGEAAWGHADTAMVGVALFTRSAAGWVLARRVDELFEDGSYGAAPTPVLVADAVGGHWLWFTGADTGQGLSYGYGVLVSIDAAGFAVAGRFETGGDNAGACAERRAEWDALVGPCWSWRAAAELVGVGEREVLLRLAHSGTESDTLGADAEISERRGIVCHGPRGAQARWTPSPCPERIAWRTALPTGPD